MAKRMTLLLLCVVLLGAAQGGALAEQEIPRGFTLYENYTHYDESYVESCCAIGDTLYLLWNQYEQAKGLWQWKLGMEEPEPVLPDLIAYTDDGGSFSLELDSEYRLFTDGKALYILEMDTGNVKKIINEDGASLDEEPLYCIQPKSNEDADSAFDGLESIFALDNSLFIVTREGISAQCVVSAYDLRTGDELYRSTHGDLRRVAPYRDGQLLLALAVNAASDETNAADTDIVVYDIKSEAITKLGSFKWVDTSALLYSQSKNTVYMIDGDEVYRLPEGQSVPEISAYIPYDFQAETAYNIVLVGDAYYACAEYSYTLVRPLEMPYAEQGKLMVGNVEYEYAYYNGYLARPELPAFLGDDGYSDIDEALAVLGDDDDAFDVFLFNTQIFPWGAFTENNAVAELSPYESITTAISRMEPNVAQALMKDGKPYAMPISITAYTLGYNRHLWYDVLHLTEQDLPKTYVELFAFMKDYYDQYGNDESAIPLFVDDGIENALIEVMELYEAYQARETGEIKYDTPLMRTLAAAAKGVAKSEQVKIRDSGSGALFDFHVVAQPEADAYEYDDDETEFVRLILPLDEGLEPLVQAEMVLAVMNPHSAIPQLATEFMAGYANRYDESSRIVLLKQPNEAVKEEEATISEEEIQWYKEHVAPYLYIKPETETTMRSQRRQDMYDIRRQFLEGEIDIDGFVRAMDDCAQSMQTQLD